MKSVALLKNVAAFSDNGSKNVVRESLHVSAPEITEEQPRLLQNSFRKCGLNRSVLEMCVV